MLLCFCPKLSNSLNDLPKIWSNKFVWKNAVTNNLMTNDPQDINYLRSSGKMKHVFHTLDNNKQDKWC